MLRQHFSKPTLSPTIIEVYQGWKCPRLNPRGERLDARRQSLKCRAPRKGSSWNLPFLLEKNWNLGQFSLKQTKLGKQNHSEIWLLWYFGEDARMLFPISNAQFWVKNWKRHISLRFPEFLEHHHKQAQVYINHSKINRLFSVCDRVSYNFRLETVLSLVIRLYQRIFITNSTRKTNG